MSAKLFEITGTIVSIGDEQQKTPTFKIREFSLDVGDDKRPNCVTFQLLGDNTDCSDPFGVGERVNVEFYLKGYQRFVNLTCVGIQAVGSETRNYRPRKEPEAELPLPNEPHYMNEQIPTGRTLSSQKAEDVLGSEPVHDLPFMWLLVAGLTGIGSLAQMLPNF